MSVWRDVLHEATNTALVAQLRQRPRMAGCPVEGDVSSEADEPMRQQEFLARQKRAFDLYYRGGTNFPWQDLRSAPSPQMAIYRQT